MPLALKAIKPRHSVMATTNLDSLIRRQLGEAGFAGDMIRAMGDYPAFLPWTSPTPTKGPRKGGRRTGTLGRNWRMSTPGRNVVEVTNAVRYAVYVEGPRRGAKGRRQTRVMRRRNWPNITDTSLRVWRKHRRVILGILKQTDRRLRRRRIR